MPSTQGVTGQKHSPKTADWRSEGRPEPEVSGKVWQRRAWSPAGSMVVAAAAFLWMREEVREQPAPPSEGRLGQAGRDNSPPWCIWEGRHCLSRDQEPSGSTEPQVQEHQGRATC